MAHYDCGNCGASIYHWDSHSGECTQCTSKEYRDLKIKVKSAEIDAEMQWEEDNKELLNSIKEQKRDFVEAQVKALKEQLKSLEK